jgi:hypothetical protein
MPVLQDQLSVAQTLEAKYEQVLRFDKMMRELVLSQLPSCLNNQYALEPTWPQWVAVARRCLTITSAHKIIVCQLTHTVTALVDVLTNIVDDTSKVSRVEFS